MQPAPSAERQRQRQHPDQHSGGTHEQVTGVVDRRRRRRRRPAPDSPSPRTSGHGHGGVVGAEAQATDPRAQPRISIATRSSRLRRASASVSCRPASSRRSRLARSARAEARRSWAVTCWRVTSRPDWLCERTVASAERSRRAGRSRVAGMRRSKSPPAPSSPVLSDELEHEAAIAVGHRGHALAPRRSIWSREQPARARSSARSCGCSEPARSLRRWQGASELGGVGALGAALLWALKARRPRRSSLRRWRAPRRHRRVPPPAPLSSSPPPEGPLGSTTASVSTTLQHPGEARRRQERAGRRGRTGQAGREPSPGAGKPESTRPRSELANSGSGRGHGAQGEREVLELAELPAWWRGAPARASSIACQVAFHGALRQVHRRPSSTS